jgi:hypothetical protein
MGTSSPSQFLEYAYTVYENFAISHKCVYTVHIGYGQCWTNGLRDE